MKYDISKSASPKMPNLGKGTECIKLLLSQASVNMHEPLVPMFFPVLGAHISGAEFQYPDNSWKEMTGMMANLVANSGDNKGQLAPIVEAICRDFRQHDKEEEDKYREWQKLSKTEPSNKKKTAEPQLQLKEVLPNLVRHQLPEGCKDYSEYYLRKTPSPPQGGTYPLQFPRFAGDRNPERKGEGIVNRYVQITLGYCAITKGY